MTRYHRIQVLLEPEQYQHLRWLARVRSAQEGHRVSVSRIVRELLNQALAQEAAAKDRTRAAHMLSLPSGKGYKPVILNCCRKIGWIATARSMMRPSSQISSLVIDASV